MIVITPELIRNKKVLLRLDLDVVLEEGTGNRLQVADDFRLKAALPTLKLCLENAAEVIMMGHIGRPGGRVDEELSVEPIYDWLKDQDLSEELESGKLRLLENLRFESGEYNCDLEYAKELAALGDVFVNESFAAYHPAASTTVLPTLLPHCAGLRFAKEVEEMKKIKGNHPSPLLAIIGGAKVEDKLPAVLAMAKIADTVLVGGKVAEELAARGPVASVSRVRPRPSTHSTDAQGRTEQGRSTTSSGHAVDARDLSSAPPLADNILLAKLNEEGTDITKETVEAWKEKIKEAKMIVWNGPLGKVEEPKNFQTHEIANAVVSSGAETILGGGDTVTYLDKLGLLERFSFVSTGGGAMLEYLTKGTLPTIEVLV